MIACSNLQCTYIILHCFGLQRRHSQGTYINRRDKTGECSTYHLECFPQDNSSGKSSKSASFFTRRHFNRCLWGMLYQSLRRHGGSHPTYFSRGRACSLCFHVTRQLSTCFCASGWEYECLGCADRDSFPSFSSTRLGSPSLFDRIIPVWNHDCYC